MRMSHLPSHLYGESIFTTTRTIDSKVLFKDQHVERLLGQVNEYYFFGKRKIEDLSLFLEIDNKLEQAAKTSPNHIVRMMVYADRREALVPDSFSVSDLRFDIQSRTFPNAKPLTLKSYPSPFSEDKINIKAGSYFQNFYFKRLAIGQGFDDALFVSNRLVTEASTANILFEKNGAFYTTSHGSVFPGIGLEILKNFGIKIKLIQINLDELNEFESCYLVNSVHPLTPVSCVDSTSFTNSRFETMMRDLDRFLRSQS